MELCCVSSNACTDSLIVGKDWLNTTNTEEGNHWFSPNFVYVSPNGTEFTGGEPAWRKMFDEEYYAYFTKWHHEPYSIVCFEADAHDCEYEMVGQAQVYANLVGEPDGQPKVINPKDGQEWDIVRPGAWHFWYEKTDDPKHEGYQLRRLHLMMDSAPIVARLIHKGDLDHTHLIDKHVAT